LIGKVEAVAMATAIYYSIEQLWRFVMLKNAGVANGAHHLVARIMNGVRRAMAYAVHSGVRHSRTAYGGERRTTNSYAHSNNLYGHSNLRSHSNLRGHLILAHNQQSHKKVRLICSIVFGTVSFPKNLNCLVIEKTQKPHFSHLGSAAKNRGKFRPRFLPTQKTPPNGVADNVEVLKPANQDF
jgi:hypothetical protein